MIKPNAVATTFMDTHAVIWLSVGSAFLGPKTRRWIDQCLGKGELALSAAVIYELHWLDARGRLPTSSGSAEIIRNLQSVGVELVGVSAQIAEIAAKLPLPHGDPVDRMIVATAAAIGGVLITADQDVLNAKLDCRIMDARL
jgi:PIN domain nuclease of toxin-antitoxin system